MLRKPQASNTAISDLQQHLVTGILSVTRSFHFQGQRNDATTLSVSYRNLLQPHAESRLSFVLRTYVLVRVDELKSNTLDSSSSSRFDVRYDTVPVGGLLVACDIPVGTRCRVTPDTRNGYRLAPTFTNLLPRASSLLYCT